MGKIIFSVLLVATFATTATFAKPKGFDRSKIYKPRAKSAQYEKKDSSTAKTEKPQAEPVKQEIHIHQGSSSGLTSAIAGAAVGYIVADAVNGHNETQAATSDDKDTKEKEVSEKA